MLELTFMPDGSVELTDPDDEDEGEVIWASDTDEDFREAFNQELLTESDAERVIDWLTDHDFIDEDEAAAIEVYAEDEGPGDDDEDDDETEGQTYDAQIG